MKNTVLIVLTLIFLSYLQVFPSFSLVSKINRSGEDIDRVDSLNLNLLGSWNFSYPCAIYTDEDYLYLGSGGGVIIFDVSDRTNPEKVGDISFPGMYVWDIFVLDILMFIADGEKGLRIADISDPFHPVEIGSYDMFWAEGVFAKNQLAYVTQLSKDTVYVGELAIYDVSNPQAPLILAKDTLPKFHPDDVIVKDEYAYVANGQGGLRIIDVSDSTNPFEISYFKPSGYAYDFVICYDTLVLLSTMPAAGCKGGLWVINIKDPYNPYPLDCDTSFWEGFDVSYFSHYAYVSSVSEGVKIIDFADPTDINIVGEFHPPIHPPYLTWNYVNVNIGYYVYLGERWGNGLRTIDASNPGQPITIDYDLIPDESYDISIQGNYAYIANRFSGIYIIDISDSSNPQEVSNYDTPGLCNNIRVRDSIAYVADDSSVILLNIKNPYNPEKISELPLACYGEGLALNFPYLYVSNSWNAQFIIVDVSTPQIPFIAGACYADSTYLEDICYKDSFAFASSSNGVAVINIANAQNPIHETYCPVYGGYSRAIGYRENYLYAVTDAAINIIDITNPTAPIIIDTLGIMDWYASALSISDSLLYITYSGGAIEVYDISIPILPQLVGHYIGYPLGVPLRITTVNGLAYLVADNGLYIFQYTGSSGIEEENNEFETSLYFKCYPSTFSEKVFIELNIKREENTKIEVYDAAGRKIKNIFSGRIEGRKLFTWKGLNNSGTKVSSGVYFTKLESGDFTSVKKVILVR